jgi:hypothetical protein
VIEKVKQLLAPDGVFVVITPHTDDVPAERRSIAVNDSDLNLLSNAFRPLALYKGDEQGGPLTYFVGE